MQAGHGHFTTGAMVDKAVWWFISFDMTCHTEDSDFLE
ncbi:MAG: hypothetical protein GY929_24365 [Actinomycetia bacterium]|nr:hypothetical protein [Actinomycetes bacterium]